jgi:hypothetical protein
MILVFLAGSLWAMVAISLPVDGGEPCGGSAANFAEKAIVGLGWFAAAGALVSALSYPEVAARWAWRWALATGVCIVIWVALIDAANC